MAVVSSELQSGSFVEIFSPQGSSPSIPWKVVGDQKGVSKTFDKTVKGYVYSLNSGGKVQLPKDEKAGLGLGLPYLVMQVYLLPGTPFSFELLMTDMGGIRRRVLMSPSYTDVKVDHCQACVPLGWVLREAWVNLVLPLVDMVNELFRGPVFRRLEGLTIAAEGKLRKVFALRDAPADVCEDQIGAMFTMPMPKGLDFPVDSESHTQYLRPAYLVSPPATPSATRLDVHRDRGPFRTGDAMDGDEEEEEEEQEEYEGDSDDEAEGEDAEDLPVSALISDKPQTPKAHLNATWAPSSTGRLVPEHPPASRLLNSSLGRLVEKSGGDVASRRSVSAHASGQNEPEHNHPEWHPDAESSRTRSGPARISTEAFADGLGDLLPPPRVEANIMAPAQPSTEPVPAVQVQGRRPGRRRTVCTVPTVPEGADEGGANKKADAKTNYPNRRLTQLQEAASEGSPSSPGSKDKPHGANNGATPRSRRSSNQPTAGPTDLFHLLQGGESSNLGSAILSGANLQALPHLAVAERYADEDNCSEAGDPGPEQRVRMDADGEEPVTSAMLTRRLRSLRTRVGAETTSPAKALPVSNVVTPTARTASPSPSPTALEIFNRSLGTSPGARVNSPFTAGTRTEDAEPVTPPVEAAQQLPQPPPTAAGSPNVKQLLGDLPSLVNKNPRPRNATVAQAVPSPILSIYSPYHRLGVSPARPTRSKRPNSKKAPNPSPYAPISPVRQRPAPIAPQNKAMGNPQMGTSPGSQAVNSSPRPPHPSSAATTRPVRAQPAGAGAPVRKVPSVEPLGPRLKTQARAPASRPAAKGGHNVPSRMASRNTNTVTPSSYVRERQQSHMGATTVDVEDDAVANMDGFGIDDEEEVLGSRHFRKRLTSGPPPDEIICDEGISESNHETGDEGRPDYDYYYTPGVGKSLNPDRKLAGVIYGAPRKQGSQNDHHRSPLDPSNSALCDLAAQGHSRGGPSSSENNTGEQNVDEGTEMNGNTWASAIYRNQGYFDEDMLLQGRMETNAAMAKDLWAQSDDEMGQFDIGARLIQRAFTPPIIPPSCMKGNAATAAAQCMPGVPMPERAPAINSVTTSDVMVDLLYDPVLNCYFDIKTNQYYELIQ